MFTGTIVLALAATACATYSTTSIPAYLSNPTIDASGSWRIIGGSDAAAGAYPYIVSLRGPVNNHFCGGSIINSQAILTAAHCIIGLSPLMVSVVAGTNTLNAGGVTVHTQALIIHSDYVAIPARNDIAVITLQTDLAFNGLIAPVTLNTADTGAVAATLMGWGRTETDGPRPNNLQRLDTQTLTHSDCRSDWGSYYITEKHLCAFSKSGEGACYGDSGSPLVQAENQYQLGIASFVRPCAVGMPDVYTKVSEFTTWIENAVSS